MDVVATSLRAADVGAIAIECELAEAEAAAAAAAQRAPSAVLAEQMLAYLALNDLASAKHLWQRNEAAQAQPELLAAWRVGQALWSRDAAATYAALEACAAGAGRGAALAEAAREGHRARVAAVLGRAYESIRAADAAAHLGLSEEDAKRHVAQLGWAVEESGLLVPCALKKQVPAGAAGGTGQLTRLTEYVREQAA